MKQQKTSQSQTQYRTSMWLASFLCALVLAWTFVGLSRSEGIGASLMASVSNVGNNSEITVHFDANIALQDTGDTLRLIAGTQMQAVDSIEGIIAFDGSKGLAITVDSPEHMTELAPGVYRFHIPMNEKTVNKGMIIAYFSKNSDISLPMSLTDTEFVSGGERYHLSNTVE